MTHAIEFIETPTFTRKIMTMADVIYLILAYPKSTKDSLTAREKATLKALTQTLKGEVTP